MEDLHCHSTASDGSLPPAEVVARAAERGVTTLALTDHDTIAGHAEARAEGERRHVRLVTGIELSCKVERGSGHLLGYFAADTPPEVRDRLAEMERARAGRAGRIVERLVAAGAPIALEDVTARASGPIGRPHIADALVAAGHARNRADAFDRWIGPDGPGFVPHSGLTLDEAVEMVSEAGGAPVLAHPDTLGLSDRALADRMGELQHAGLVGIEVHRPDHPESLRSALARLAAASGLIASGGSDFHRPDGDVEVGDTGKPGLPDGTADRLLAGARVR